MCKRLVKEQAVLLGLAHDRSTVAAYTSAFNSYINFCELHRLPLDPTPETLSLYITYQTSFIAPASVASYLSGICNELEVYFPNARDNRNSRVVARTLKGAMRRYNKGPNRKEPLTRQDLDRAFTDTTRGGHDDLLFLAMLTCGFYGLLRLAEMTFPDTMALHD
jgi:hypothetical protein